MILSERIDARPLVSVIIPCFNQGRFLQEAIASVQKQTYPDIEIIVVDDGSTDNTRTVASSIADVKYFYQSNAGLSAARNYGISHCKGAFLVFLDADDILYPEAIASNLKLLLQNPSWAFVSGGHHKVDAWLFPLKNQEETEALSHDHFNALLKGNYIGMHAAVMYRFRVFDEFEFDTTLEACEDYDLFLRIARKYPVGSHAEKIAAYRHHDTNMSANFFNMLTQVLRVHKRQLARLVNDAEKYAWHEGLRNWKTYYATRMYQHFFCAIEKEKKWPSRKEMKLMAAVIPARFKNYVVKKALHNFKDQLKRFLPDKFSKWLHHKGIYRWYVPPPGKIDPGDFNRVTPFSADFGFDRGGAIDRFFIENFLQENQLQIRGRVLEIGDNAYTLKYGGDKILRSDVFHVMEGNPGATYTGDITDVPQIPSDEFDCIIFTQTLHLIYDFKSALRTCYRILRPGGCLLLTVPGISQIDRGEWRDYWLWSFTNTSIKRLMSETFRDASVNVRTYGNVYVAAAFLYGMGLPELPRDFLFRHDPSYQLIISATAIKS